MNLEFGSSIQDGYLKSKSIPELEQIAEDIRLQIIDVMSKNGGHLASNLGTVELTLALHRVFDSPKDKFVFDVSHQAYTHKILTGREKEFSTIRQHGGLSGFTSPKESLHDHFYAGHAGTALSLALGMAKSRDLSGENYHIIPIIGDASLTCGLTLEALNNIPKNLSRFLVILNDNKMSISENVGAITQILGRLINHPKSNKFYKELKETICKIPGYGLQLARGGSKIKGSIKNLFSSAPFFEQFNLAYVGMVDGHNLEELINILEQLKNDSRSILLHVSTIKGYGMPQAASNPSCYHGVKPFDRKTGLSSKNSNKTFPQVFGELMSEIAEKDPKVVVITPAMPQGSCLEKLMKEFPDRTIDVGIAEGHALTYAAGIAKYHAQKVFISIYSTFLQRAFDNLFHDICLQEIPCILAIDRAGLSSADGATHHGIYDLGFLTMMPNLIVAQPRSSNMLESLIKIALESNQPFAIRYPNLIAKNELEAIPFEMGKGQIIKKGSKVLLIPLGHFVDIAAEIAKMITLEYGFEATIFDPIFIKPIDKEQLIPLFYEHELIITLEEHSLIGGLGSIINQLILQENLKTKRVKNFGIPNFFVEHGSYHLLLEELGLSANSIFAQIKSELDHQ